MGRPPKTAKDSRSRIVAVRLTPSEYKELAKASKTLKLKESEILRRCIKMGLQSVEVYRLKRRKIP
jgi:hypothetical protein